VSPLRGENPIFGPLSKNNTGTAALRAGLPVTTAKSLGHAAQRQAPASLW